MYIELIPEAGKFYKVNMHTHTTLSDGKQTPEQIKEWYKSHGYSAVCYTDHEVLLGHEDLCDDEFIALHGYEIAIKESEQKHTGNFNKAYHFNILAKRQDQRYMPKFYRDNPSCAGASRQWINSDGVFDREGDDYIDHTEYDLNWINPYLEAIASHGFLITYNHPMWSLQDATDYAELRNIHAVELINGSCLHMNDNTSVHYQALLRHGVRAVAVAGDDNHSEASCGKGWTMIKAPELSYGALMEAYENGYCYATEGPEIKSLVIKDGKLIIKTSPAAAVSVFGQGRNVKIKRAEGEPVTEVECNYEPEKFGTYFRIEVRDAAGCKAYSTAYFTDEIAKKAEEKI